MAKVALKPLASFGAERVGAGQPLAVAEQREIVVGHAYARVYGERTVWNPNAPDPGRDATHVTANTTLPRRPRSRLRANAARADASGKISRDGRRSAPASASLAIDQSWSRFGSTVKYSPPSGGSSATETSRPPGRSTAPDRRSRSPPTVSN